MRLKIFSLDEYKFYYTDPLDGEKVEDIRQIGFFDSEEELNRAIKICKRFGIPEQNRKLRIFDYDMNFSSNQNYLYTLEYGYSIKSEEGNYNDYFYDFPPPKKSRKECMLLKKNLLKNIKYQPSSNKIYDLSSDGFIIVKWQINNLYEVVSIREPYWKNATLNKYYLQTETREAQRCCDFCNTVITVGQEYFSPDDKERIICKRCLKDFAERFNWKVKTD